MKGGSEKKEKYPESPIISEDQKMEEIRAIREKLSEMHIDIKKVMEYSSRLRFETALEGSRHEHSNALLNHLFEDIETGLERNMVKKCPEKKKCTSAFTVSPAAECRAYKTKQK